MTPSKPCKRCGETKPLDAFGLTSFGGTRGTCRSCRSSHAVENKRARREAKRAAEDELAGPKASPANCERLECREREQQRALARQNERAEAVAQREAKRERTAAGLRACNSCGETKRLDAFQACYAQCRDCANDRRAERRAIAAAAARGARRSLRKEIADDLWTAMRTGRSRRLQSEALPRPTETHRLKLRDSCGGGYITIAELACRCLERGAVSRAVRACESHADTPKYIRVLEQNTPSGERRRIMAELARSPRLDAAVPLIVEPEPEEQEDDPFGDAFGDWAPAWMSSHDPTTIYA